MCHKALKKLNIIEASSSALSASNCRVSVGRGFGATTCHFLRSVYGQNRIRSYNWKGPLFAKCSHAAPPTCDGSPPAPECPTQNLLGAAKAFVALLLKRKRFSFCALSTFHAAPTLRSRQPACTLSSSFPCKRSNTNRYSITTSIQEKQL